VNQPIEPATLDARYARMRARMHIIQPDGNRAHADAPQITIIDRPSFQADPEVDGTPSEPFVAVCRGHKPRGRDEDIRVGRPGLPVAFGELAGYTPAVACWIA
jgi:hypothetical protein